MTKWKWEPKQQETFDDLKLLLLKRTLLGHYNETKPLLTSCDALPYGVGSALAQEDSFGREALVAFASRTSGAAECSYAQLV